jgi:hypothetical protein
VAPSKGKKSSDFGYANAVLKKNKKIILLIRLNSTKTLDGKHEISFLVDKSEFKNLSLSLTYLVHEEPVVNKKNGTITLTACGEEFTYELALKEFIKE